MGNAAARLVVMACAVLAHPAALAALPSATTSPASAVTSTSALLNGAGTPAGEASTGFFRLSTTSAASCDAALGTRVPSVGGTALGAGVVPVAFSITTTGLVGGSTYYFCAGVTNASGTRFGNVQSFTAPGTPVVTTGAASAITSTGATLAATANPRASSTTGFFRFSTSSAAVCGDTFGTRSPASGGTALGAGVAPVAYATTLTGLQPGTRYFFCALANNAIGTSVGTIASFTTAPARPVIASTGVTNVTSRAATLTGSVNPSGAATTSYFRIATADPGTCNDAFGARTPATGGTVTAASTTTSSYSEVITGLLPSTTYFYCAIGQNSVGTSFGALQTFSTSAAPTVTTQAATNVADVAATLNGTATPNRASAIGYFRYSTTNPGTCDDTFGTRAPTTAGSALGSGTTASTFSQAVTGLQPGTTYFFCALADNSEGTGAGQVLSFTTPTSPSVTTQPATAVQATAATLNGVANPNRAASTGYFRFSTTNPGVCNDSFGTRAPATGGTELGSGAAPVAFQAALTGLAPATTYFFCALASNTFGTSTGSIGQLTTPAARPSPVTGSASALSSRAATLNGLVNPGGAVTTAWFRFATSNPGTCNDTFGARVPAAGGTTIAAGQAAAPYEHPITGLSPSTTYFFCALASNEAGDAVGAVQSFTTPSLPVASTLAPTGLANTSVTLNGSANPSRSATTGYFRFATSNPGTCNDTFGARAPDTGGTALGNGATAVTFTQPLAGLVGGTTYFFCAIAENAEGRAFGIVQSFRTPTTPTVSTSPATAVAATTATLNGLATPNGAASTGFFRFSTTDPGVCNETFGTRAPAAGGATLGAGNTPVAYATTIASLPPATTVFFCAVATNQFGTSTGPLRTFTTPPAAPTVTTTTPTLLTSSSVTLNANVNPNGADATVWFRLSTTSPGACNDAFGTRAPASGGTILGGGVSALAHGEPVAGLRPSTTYFACALANNAVGITVGNLVTFTTPAGPTVTSQAPTDLSNVAATLNGAASPNRSATTGYFRLSTTNPGICDDVFGTRAPTAGGVELGNGSVDSPFSQAVADLQPGTTYFFCAIAQNVEGTGFGLVRSFTTPTAPTVATSPATALTATSATLAGAANPNGGASTGYFRFSTDDPGACNDGFGTRTPEAGGAELGAGSTSAAFSNVLAGLSPATTYFYCAVASNAFGTSVGELRQFTTLATRPTAMTSPVTALAARSASLNAAVNPGGAATTAWFRFSTQNPGACNDAFGTRTPSTGGVAVAAGNSPVAVSSAVDGLLPSTSYFYCALAENALGIATGAIQTFTTPAPPVATTQAPTALLDTSATLNGSANPNRAEATGFFRLSTTNPGACDDRFGTRVPAEGGVALGSGAVAGAFSVDATGLAPGTTYFACALATSAEGTATGNLVTFTTSSAPTVTAAAPSFVAATSAVLNGSANPRGADATAFFRLSTSSPGLCNDAFGARAPATGGAAIAASSPTTTYGQTVTGLLPATTYFFCAGATNRFGTSFGALSSFTTAAAPPATTTTAATNVTATSARLNGAVVPGGALTTARFRFQAGPGPGVCNDSFGTPAPLTGGTNAGAGLDLIAFSEPVTGLQPSTTYFFCAIADNAVGSTLGTLQSFTTPARPDVATAAATSVLDVSATLNGAATPNGASTTGFFRFSTTNPGTCTDSFGTRAPSSGGVALGDGTSSTVFFVPVTGLPPNTTVFFCALATNAEGTAVGSVQTFTTSAAPNVTTAAATAVSSSAATLQGAANPNGGAATTGFFRFAAASPGVCNESFGVRLPLSGGTDLGSGRTLAGFTATATGLSPATTYFYCAIASNAHGTSVGSVQSFTTSPTTPTVTTTAPSATTSTTATLAGVVVPGGAATTGYFRFGATNPGACSESFGARVPGVGGVSLGAGVAETALSVALGGLTPDTTYFFCAIAENAVGTTLGGLTTFTTPAPPLVTTEPAANVSGAATLRGTIDPRGATATGHFRFSTLDPVNCDDSFGTRAPATGGVPVGTGRTPVAFSADVTSLSPSTTYFYCAIGRSAEGTSVGAVQTFTTPPVPSTTTMAATPVTATTATLNALVNPNGFATTLHFRFSDVEPLGCTDAFGGRAPGTGGVLLGAGTDDVSASQDVAGLLPGTTYFFCAIATSTLGPSFGTPLSFTTPALLPSTTTQAPDQLTPGSARLTAVANPNGGDSIGWFRYSATNPGLCDDTFGTRVPSTGGVTLGSGNSGVAFERSVVDLQAQTAYFVCAFAQNDVGLATGGVVSFRTPDAPVATTQPASAITSSSATLSSSVVANGAATQVYFRFSSTPALECNDTFGARAPATGGIDAGAGFTAATLTQTIEGLSPGTTYFFCPIASNAFGTTFGALTTLRTLASVPVAETEAATQLTAVTASLHAQVDPRGGATEVWFRFDTQSPGTCNDTFGTRAPQAGATAVVDGIVGVPVARTVDGLQPGTTYFFCVLAQNVAGAGIGLVSSFTTPDIPDLTTTAATAVTATSATLNGAATPNRAPSVAWFRLATSDPGACDDTFGTRFPASGGVDVGDGPDPVPFTQQVAGLDHGTTYFYCALAENLVGMGVGPVRSFTTPARPTVSTQAATDVTGSAATLRATATPNLASTTGHFRFATTDPGACDDTFGTRAPVVGGAALGAGSTPVAFAQALTGLTPGTTYFFCAFADNEVGAGAGSVRSFTTPSQPTVTTLVAASVTATTVTLRGEAVPNLAAATGFFRVSTTDPGSCDGTSGTRAPTVGGSSLGAGTTAVPYTQSLVALSPATTYFVCAYAQNAVGTGAGTVVAFTTATPPAVTTAETTSITATTALLRGVANPGRAATTGHFRFSTTDPGACTDAFGTRAPSAGGIDLGAGDVDVSFSTAVEGLQPGTTYFVCAIADNDAGTGTGAVRSFTTPTVPTATTTGAMAVTASSAQLLGAANPNLGEATGYFRLSATRPPACDDAFGERVPVSGGIALGADDADVAFSVEVSGLSAGTTYFFCALAGNDNGTSAGALLSFTTPTQPTATTLPASDVRGVEATLAALVDAGGAPTEVYFRLDTNDPGVCDDAFGTRVPLTGSTSLPADAVDIVVAEPAIGLSPNTRYFFCVVATNALGTTFGALATFTTPDPPIVTTRPANDVATSSVTLRGEAIPQRAETTGFFRYDTIEPGRCDDLFGTRAPASGGTALGAGTDAVAWQEALVDLVPGTTYFFCALAESSEGVVGGDVLSFTTPAAPVATTIEAIDVTSASATLTGSVNPRGEATTAAFRIDTIDPGTCDGTFGVRVPQTGGATLAADFIDVPFTQAVFDLQPATTYFFCAVADSALGVGAGAVRSFTTPAAPTVTTAEPAAVSSRSVTLAGTVNPNRSPTTAWFRLAASDPGVCDDSFGVRVPSDGGASLGSGSDPVDFAEVTVDVQPDTTYFFCAIAANDVGSRAGEVRSFTTPRAPTVVTAAPTEVARTQAVLSATASPNRADTLGWFRVSDADPVFCDDARGVRVPGEGGLPLGTSTEPVAFAATIGSLVPGARYWVCAVAQNEAGVAVGLPVSFVADDVPVVTTTLATAVTARAAVLNALVDPAGSPSRGWFRYADVDPGVCDDDFGERVPADGAAPSEVELGAGNGDVALVAGVAGLRPRTTYWYCALAGNDYGVAVGAVRSFSTMSDLPDVATGAAAPLSSTTASASATVTANGAPTTLRFLYSPVEPAACDDAFAAAASTSDEVIVDERAVAELVTGALTGLQGDTTYWLCAVAQNEAGRVRGELAAFTTPPLPTVTTEEPHGVVATAATLRATVHPEGAATRAWFRYAATEPDACDDTFGTRTAEQDDVDIPADARETPYDARVIDLVPATTYWVCAVARSDSGIAFGAPVAFTTPPAPPTVTTQAPSEVTTSSARLTGAVVANGAATTAWFRYSSTRPDTCDDTFGVRVSAGGADVGDGHALVSFDAVATPLRAGVTYWFCAIAGNDAGLGFGALQSFVTGATAPTARTRSALEVTDDGAVLLGVGIANGSATTGWFRLADSEPLACSESVGVRLPEDGGVDLGAAGDPRSFAVAATSLQPNRSYWFCAVARNDAGASFGAVRAFTTAAAPPVVRTEATTVVGSLVTLRGAVDPNGSRTTAWFRIGDDDPGACDDTFGERVPDDDVIAVGGGRGEEPISFVLRNVSAGTRWVCAVARNEGGVAFGEPVAWSVEEGCSSSGATSPALGAMAVALGALAACRRRRRAGPPRN